MKTLLALFIILLASCTIGTSNHVTINEYGDSDTIKSGQFINNISYTKDSTKINKPKPNKTK